MNGGAGAGRPHFLISDIGSSAHQEEGDIKLVQRRASLQYDVDGRSSTAHRQTEILPAFSRCNLSGPGSIWRTWGFEAFRATRAEVITNSTRALLNTIVDLDSFEPCEEVPLRIGWLDPQSVLVNWLSAILYVHRAERWLCRDFEIQCLDDHKLISVARGSKFQRPRHQPKVLVKAITYHQLDFGKTLQRWRARVYVDIRRE